jgi:hypothetical protein
MVAKRAGCGMHPWLITPLSALDFDWRYRDLQHIYLLFRRDLQETEILQRPSLFSRKEKSFEVSDCF